MPKLIRLFISQSLLGFVIAGIFVATLLWFDFGNLYYLMTHNDWGPFAILLLWAHMGLLCGAVQFAIAVMALAGADDGRPGGGSKLGLIARELVRGQAASNHRSRTLTRR